MSPSQSTHWFGITHHSYTILNYHSLFYCWTSQLLNHFLKLKNQYASKTNKSFEDGHGSSSSFNVGPNNGFFQFWVDAFGDYYLNQDRMNGWQIVSYNVLHSLAHTSRCTRGGFGTTLFTISGLGKKRAGKKH
jgi:hypothetical protein